MKLVIINLLCILMSSLTACDFQTPIEPQFEVEEILANQPIVAKTISKDGLYYTFTPPSTTNYSITLSNQTTDFDLVLGVYDKHDQFENQEVLRVSKTPSLDDETIDAVTLSSDTTYLIEVWNYSLKSGSYTLQITETE